jgi:intracellular multiplication protein IcmC
MADTNFPDLMQVIVNISKHTEPLIMMLQGIAGLVALILFAQAMLEIWAVTDNNATKYLPGRQRYSIMSAIATVLVASALLAMSDLQLVGVLSRTLSGDYATSRITPEAMSYGGADISEKAQVATMGLLMILQVVGFIAMFRGWLSINHFFNATSQASFGTALAWLIGGILCWNAKWVSDVINNTIGFNVIGMFGTIK